MVVTIDNEDIKVLIERKNNKNIYFRFKEDLTLYITCNNFVSDKEIIKLIKKNQKALIKMYQSAKKVQEKNSEFHLLGKSYTIVNDINEKNIRIEEDLIFVKDNKTLEKFLKKETKRIFENRINEFLPIMSFVPEFELKIRKMKTRWGVCNRFNKTVTLNSELIKKDISLIDYVIVHELCHFKHGHHQKKFWDEVSKYYPNWKKARKLLKE